MTEEGRPSSFSRMLSWEFSRPSIVVVRRSTRTSRPSSKSGAESDRSLSDEDVAGSDSSDYKSVGESEEGGSQNVADLEGECQKSEDVVLPTSERRRLGLSKKQKRKRNRGKRDARIEFFSPFIEGFEEDAVEDAAVAAAEHEISVRRMVPTLSEFCVQTLWGSSALKKQPLQSESALRKPLFMDQMKWQRQAHQLTASVQLKWLHRCLADLESREPKDSTNQPKYYDWTLQSSFTAEDYYSGLFTPLPHPDPACNLYDAVAALAHVADLMVPVVDRLRSCSTTESRDSYRPVAVWRLRSALQARYPKLTAKLLDDILPYVWWARGDLHQAAEMLVDRSRALKDIDKNLCGLYLNEAGRLYCQVGDRDMASKFFRLATEAVPEFSYPSYSHTSPRSEMVSMSALALSAATWDQGVLDDTCGVQAGGSWKAVLLYNDLPPPVNIEAVFSRLSVHAGVAVGSSDPDKHAGVLGCAAWLVECVTLVASLAEKLPQLYHPLSLLYALQGKEREARQSHLEYVDKFAGFETWENGLPGSHHGMALGESPQLNIRANPWLGLIKLTKSLNMPPPVLKLVWRYRLSHPPMCRGTTVDRLAYHVSKSLTIRLSEHGNITVDAISHHPPIRGLQLDPHTGALCFPQLPGTTTPWMSLPSEESLSGGCMMPVPITVLDVDGRTQVELLQANSESRNKKFYFMSENNLTLLYMIDCVTKQRVKVDLRSLVRKKLKEVFLGKASRETDKPFEDRKKVIDYFFTRGLFCTWKNDVRLAKIPDALQASKTNGFHMQLKSIVTYGSATVALFFNVISKREEDPPDTVIIVDCQDVKTFKRPNVYGLNDDSSFGLPLCPDLHRKSHFPDAKLLLCTNTRKRSSLLIFNECGEVTELDLSDPPRELQPEFTAIIGESLYSLTSSRNAVGCWCVESSEILMKLESGPLPTVLAVKAAGNILCVLTAKGLCVLDPDSLIAIPMGATEPGKSCSRDVTGSSEDATQFVVPGEFVQLKIFKTSQLSESTKMVALSLDYTFALLTVHVHRTSPHSYINVNCTVELPGVPTEVLLLPGCRGVLVTTGLFMSDDPDFTEQLLWLSVDGELKGILPVLGVGPHAFFPLSLRPRTDIQAKRSGLHIYFCDGHGGICCAAL